MKADCPGARYNERRCTYGATYCFNVPRYRLHCTPPALIIYGVNKLTIAWRSREVDKVPLLSPIERPSRLCLFSARRNCNCKRTWSWDNECFMALGSYQRITCLLCNRLIHQLVYLRILSRINRSEEIYHLSHDWRENKIYTTYIFETIYPDGN